MDDITTSVPGHGEKTDIRTPPQPHRENGNPGISEKWVNSARFSNSSLTRKSIAVAASGVEICSGALKIAEILRITYIHAISK
ncbi:hypothetical protein [Thiomonas sp.]|uniref:hypothetical protein n=1 Tax=Thiomonas sp. TaxID=2047785 RepID=UPI002635356B|nr:hypothetical protein [Thiomonas sp.]